MTAPDTADNRSSPRQDKDRSCRLPVRARVGAAQRRFVSAARGRFEGSAAQTFLGQLGALDFANSVVLFGASLLLSVLPFIILLSSLANHRIDTDLSRHIGLNSQGARIVGQLFRSSPAHSAAPILTALVVAAAGTMAVAGSLQVIYERVFGQQHRGWRDALRFLTWPASCSGSWSPRAPSAGLSALRADRWPRDWSPTRARQRSSWWTMHFLLAGRVPWRRLIRAAMLTALLWVGLELFSSVYFSSAIISDSRLYGTIGVVFTLLTWFIAIGAVIVLGAVAGVTWDQRKGRSGGNQDRITRSGTDPARPRLRPGNSRHKS